MTTDGTITHIPDHVVLALTPGTGLPSQYRDACRVRALVKAGCAGIQDFEDMAFDVLTGTALGGAVGAQLDEWGDIVGEARGELTNDEDYRPFVRARILANTLEGTIPELVRLFGIITAPVVNMRYRLMTPGGHWFQVLRPDWMSEPRRVRVRKMMQDASPGGKTLVMVETVLGYDGPPSDPFAVPGGPLPRAI